MTASLDDLIAATPPDQLADIIATLPPAAAEVLLRDMNLVPVSATPPATFPSPLDMATALNPRVQRAPELDLINDTLVKAFNTPDARQIIAMPPQRGKSQTTSRHFALWALTQNPNLRVAVASYESNIARRWGRTVRDDLQEHAHTLNLNVRADLSSQTEWELHGYEGGMFTTGVGSAITGRSVDILIIDDPVKGREQADSELIQQKTLDWFTDNALTRLSPGAPVIIVQTRWNVDDLAGKLLNDPSGVWKLLRIPAQADHDPSKGETDPIGRKPGEYLADVRGTTRTQWEAIKQSAGPKTWAALYQGKPTTDKGNIFPADPTTYDTQWWLARPDGSRIIPGLYEHGHQELVQSWDLAFKGEEHSDYVVGQVWLRSGSQAFLLDMFRERVDFTNTIQAVQDMRARWPQTGAILIEDAANGPAVMNSLKQKIPGIIPVTPEGGKVARANAVSPFFHAGNVHLPTADLLPNVQDLRSEMLNFPHGGHDDTVDAMTQAINQLLLKPLGVNNGTGQLEDLFGSFHISDY